jgi:secretion/DNA translocation related TadE-like protein
MSRDRDRGAGTVLMLGVVAVVVVAAFVVLVATQLVSARARAQSAADLAAIAGASAVLTANGCARAELVAAENSGALTHCRTTGLDVTVEVAVPSGPLVARLARLAGQRAPQVYGTSRAGPQTGPIP